MTTYRFYSRPARRLFILTLIFLTFTPPLYLAAQQMSYIPVKFTFAGTRRQGANINFLVDFSSTESGIIAGRGVLSLCNCSCDSMLEWFFPPDDEVILGYGGAGILGFADSPGAFNASGGQSGSNNRISGTLGVTETTGPLGKIRDTPYWVSFIFRKEE